MFAYYIQKKDENYKEPKDNKQYDDNEDNEENDEPEEVIDIPKTKRVYQLTDEQLAQRRDIMARGREKMRHQILIKDEYKQSKKMLKTKNFKF